MLNDARSCRHLPRLDLTYEARPDLDVSVCCWALLVGAMRWNSEGGRKKHPNEKSNLPYPLVQVMGGLYVGDAAVHDAASSARFSAREHVALSVATMAVFDLAPNSPNA